MSVKLNEANRARILSETSAGEAKSEAAILQASLLLAS